MPTSRTPSGRAAQRLLGTITRVQTDEPLVAFTFDDGPNPAATPQVLDLLTRYNAHATFFMVGEAARRYPDLVAEVAARDHAIANHTWSHRVLPTLQGRERRVEIRRGAAAIAPHGHRLLRPPQGKQNLASRLDALRLRHHVVAWSATGEDWRGYPAERMAARMLERIGPGRIVLLHDGLWGVNDPQLTDRTPMLHALEHTLEALCDRYRFVTVPDLIRMGRPVRKNWYKHPRPSAAFPQSGPSASDP